jgi:ACT domain-containing protein
MAKKKTDKSSNVVIVTVVGKNRPGVLAEVTSAIARFNGNIMDINQKMLEDYFNLIMIVDLAGAKGGLGDFQKSLDALGVAKGYEIHVQHEKVFRYMHRV